MITPSPSRATIRARLIVSAAVLVSLYVVNELRTAFGPLLVAIGIAYVCEPLVQRLEAKTGSRMRSVLLLIFSFVAILIAISAVASRQAAELVSNLQQDQSALIQRSLENLTRLIDEQFGGLEGDLAQRIRNPETWKVVAEPIAHGMRATLESLLGWIELGGLTLLTLVYTFYLMVDLPRIWAFIDKHLPAQDRERTQRVLSTLHQGMTDFLRGRVLIALLKGVLLSIGLVVVGVPYAWVVGLGAGVLSVLPMIGPILGFLIALGVALFDYHGPMPLVWVGVVFVVAEGLENFVLTPWVMGEGVALHPLTVLFCVFFWSALFGAFGALLAIPLTITVKVIVNEYLMPEVERLARGN